MLQVKEIKVKMVQSSPNYYMNKNIDSFDYNINEQ